MTWRRLARLLVGGHARHSYNKGCVVHAFVQSCRLCVVDCVLMHVLRRCLNTSLRYWTRRAVLRLFFSMGKHRLYVSMSMPDTKPKGRNVRLTLCNASREHTNEHTNEPHCWKGPCSSAPIIVASLLPVASPNVAVICTGVAPSPPMHFWLDPQHQPPCPVASSGDRACCFAGCLRRHLAAVHDNASSSYLGQRSGHAAQ